MSMASKESIHVLVTGAIGKIGYYLVPKIARGDMLGADQPVILHLLDSPPSAEALNDVEMGLVDAAYTLLKGVVATTDVVEACTGVNIAVMIGGFQRKEVMERKDVMSDDISIYKSRVSALEKHAAANCKVLVVDNPASTIASILKEFALSIPEKNITFLTRVEHNMTLDLISKRLKVHVGDVKNAIIWGDYSSTLYPDVNHATVNTLSGDKLVREFITDDAWFQKLITTVRQGGAEMITSRESLSALYVARSACDHIHDWVIGTPEETWVSMGVYSDGSNGVPAGRFYSFPVTCRNGEWSIVQALRAPTSGISQSEDEANIRQILGLEGRFRMLHNKLNGLENQLKGTGDELNGIEIRSKVEFAYYSFRIHELEGHASRAFDNISKIVDNLESKLATLESNLATTEVHLQQAIQEIAQWRLWYWNLIHVTPVLNSHSFNHQTRRTHGGYPAQRFYGSRGNLRV